MRCAACYPSSDDLLCHNTLSCNWVPGMGDCRSGHGRRRASSRADLPDPLVGTWSMYELSHGNTYPGVFTPFGMMGWTAQMTEGNGWPYQYFRETLIGLYGHAPAVGVDEQLRPVLADAASPGALQVQPSERASHFSHNNEQALPYRYSVLLDAYKVKVEMAPSRARRRFPLHVSENRRRLRGARRDPRRRRGRDPSREPHHHREEHVGRGQIAEFRAILRGGVRPSDSRATAFGRFPKTRRDAPLPNQAAVIAADARSREGNHVGAYVGFSTTSRRSRHRAHRRLADQPGAGARATSSRTCRRPISTASPARAKSEWERQLAKIEVQGGTAAQRKTFYTAMYHAVQFPHMLQETDAAGKMVHWSPYDGKVHPGEMFADNGFWDTFRAAVPAAHDHGAEEGRRDHPRHAQCYDEGGFIPKWPNPGETNVMIGTHGDSVIADAYMKGHPRLRRRQGVRRAAQGRHRKRDRRFPGAERDRGLYQARLRSL